VLANVASKRCLIQTGRVHLYEGYTALEVCRTIRVAASLGVKNLIVTNAAGSLRKNFEPGEVVAIHDHANMSGQNPLTGLDASEGKTFVDMVNAYDEKWRDEVMLKTGIKKAAYLGLPGPNYETPFEVRMFAGLGADLVGMSTVCEVIAARHLGLKVFGLSLVTNFAAGLSQKLSHTEVLEQGAASAETAVYILEQAITSAPVAGR
jgi:purine-nucleoside phosphorylase